MKRLILFTLVLIIGNILISDMFCAEITTQEFSHYEKIYYEYNQIISEAIKQKTDMENTTEEYFKNIKEKLLTITIYKITVDGKWEKVFDRFDNDYLILLPAIHYASSERVHITKHPWEDIEYILIKTNQAQQQDSGLRITIAIKSKTL